MDMSQTKEKPEQNEQPKKCFCARCFMPIEAGDRVDVDGQSFHKMCSTCCICQQIPSSIKMFYGHVFCPECFKTHVLNKFKEPQRMHSNSWWMQWAPGMKAQSPGQDNEQHIPEDEKAEEKNDMDTSSEKDEKADKDKEANEGCDCKAEDQPKRCICARCLKAVDEKNKIDIGGQSFHPQCARCYCCHAIPKDNVKIYYGQVFCEECFNKFVLARNRESPAEHFKNCFEQMQNNSQFADSMRQLMQGQAKDSPIVFMMQGAHPPFCRCGCGNHPQAQGRDWFTANEPRKCEQST